MAETTTSGVTFEEYLQLVGEDRREWKDGQIIEMDPVNEEHDATTRFLDRVMGTYAESTDSGRVMGENYPERLNEESTRMPDVSFFRRDSLGKLRRTYSEGGADLVIEVVSPESRGRDRGDKYFEYEAAGILEYWLVDPERRQAEFYRLQEERYQTVSPDVEGRVYSEALPGFFIRVDWLWNRPRVLDALRELGLL